MSAVRSRPSNGPSEAREAVAGLMASAALFASIVGVAYKPVRLIPFAVLMAFVAARMTERHSRLAGLAVAATVVSWIVGMTIAVVTERPLY